MTDERQAAVARLLRELHVRCRCGATQPPCFFCEAAETVRSLVDAAGGREPPDAVLTIRRDAREIFRSRDADDRPIERGPVSPRAATPEETRTGNPVQQVCDLLGTQVIREVECPVRRAMERLVAYLNDGLPFTQSVLDGLCDTLKSRCSLAGTEPQKEG